MTLLAPAGLIALAAIPVLLLFYLLRVRYRDYEVGSVYLWERLFRDLAVHEPWQKPRFSVLLLLQALLVGGLALALARPAAVFGDAQRVHAVFVLDASASMGATDVAPSRFERARSMARADIGAMPDGSTGTLLLAGSRPEVLAAETADRGRLLAAVDAAGPTDAPGDPEGALRMAAALARGRPNGEVRVYSDGAFDTPRFDPTGVKVLHTTVGGGSDNRAIVALEARPEPQNRRRYQLFARVRNYAPTPAQATLSLRADGVLVDSQTLRLEADGSAAAVFGDLPVDARIVEVRLAEGDALAADDRAWAVLERRQPTQVLLVTSGNIFLERVLSLLPDVELFRVPPRRLAAIDDRAYDIIVFDGALPDVPPRRPLLIVNPPDSPFVATQGTIRTPGTLGWDTGDPLMRFVDLRDVRFARLPQLSVPPWARVVAEVAPSIGQTSATPAIIAGDVDGRRVVVFAFALQSSNLPLSASFPILMANVVGYLEPPRVLDQPIARPGAALGVLPQPVAEAIELRGEQGVLSRATPVAGAVQLDAPVRVGLYAIGQIARGAQIGLEPFAVDLVDPLESDLRPRTIDLPSDLTPRPAGPPAGRELWHWAIGAAVVLLGVEWWWFHRRA